MPKKINWAKIADIYSLPSIPVEKKLEPGEISQEINRRQHREKVSRAKKRYNCQQ